MATKSPVGKNSILFDSIIGDWMTRFVSSSARQRSTFTRGWVRLIALPIWIAMGIQRPATPVDATPRSQETHRAYHVQIGDSLWTIANKFHTSIEDLCRWNRLPATANLQVNQVLQLRPASDSGIPAKCKPVAARRDVGTVRSEVVNLRSRPSTSSDKVVALVKGTKLKVEAVSDDWCRVVTSSGKSGWVMAKYVALSTSARTIHPLGIPTTVAQRSAQGKLSADKGKGLSRHAHVHSKREPGMAPRDESPSLVMDKSTSADTDRPTPSRHRILIARAPTRDDAGRSFVNSAARYEGIPYRRGSSLPSRGFDCSGLVYRVLLSHGIRVPRSSAAMFQVGTPIERSQLKPGDLVFFKGTYRKGISHVGIFVGDNRFIHSSQPGSGVIVSSLNQPYYAQRWAGARRVH